MFQRRENVMQDKSRKNCEKKVDLTKVEEVAEEEMAKVQGGLRVTPIKADNTKDGAIEAAFEQIKK